jgi:hypothetical protein
MKLLYYDIINNYHFDVLHLFDFMRVLLLYLWCIKFNSWTKIGVFIHYMYKLNASLGKLVISGLNGGKKACAVVVSHVVCFKFINIKSREKMFLA